MKTNRTQWVILGLLAHEPMSGYDIRRAIDETIGFFWHESFGQIYPVLASLARRGLIRRSSARSDGPRRRRTYAITPKGRQALVTWLHQPPERETVRNELLLKTFFSHALPSPVLRSYIEAFLARQHTLADYYARGVEEIATVTDARQRRAWMLTVRAGQLVVDARIRWAKEALTMLEHDAPLPLPAKRSGKRSTRGGAA